MSPTIRQQQPGASSLANYFSNWHISVQIFTYKGPNLGDYVNFSSQVSVSAGIILNVFLSMIISNNPLF